MNTIINIILITFIVTFIVDISGFIDSVKYFIWKRYIKIGDYHNITFKPFTCSLCMSFWSGLIYLLLTNHFTIPFVAFVTLCSMLSSNFSDLQQYIKDLVTYIINIFYKLIK